MSYAITPPPLDEQLAPVSTLQTLQQQTAQQTTARPTPPLQEHRSREQPLADPAPSQPPSSRAPQPDTRQVRMLSNPSQAPANRRRLPNQHPRQVTCPPIPVTLASSSCLPAPTHSLPPFQFQTHQSDGGQNAQPRPDMFRPSMPHIHQLLESYDRSCRIQFIAAHEEVLKLQAIVQSQERHIQHMERPFHNLITGLKTQVVALEHELGIKTDTVVSLLTEKAELELLVGDKSAALRKSEGGCDELHVEVDRLAKEHATEIARLESQHTAEITEQQEQKADLRAKLESMSQENSKTICGLKARVEAHTQTIQNLKQDILLAKEGYTELVAFSGSCVADAIHSAQEHAEELEVHRKATIEARDQLIVEVSNLQATHIADVHILEVRHKEELDVQRKKGAEMTKRQHDLWVVEDNVKKEREESESRLHKSINVDLQLRVDVQQKAITDLEQHKLTMEKDNERLSALSEAASKDVKSKDFRLSRLQKRLAELLEQHPPTSPSSCVPFIGPSACTPKPRGPAPEDIIIIDHDEPEEWEKYSDFFQAIIPAAVKGTTQPSPLAAASSYLLTGGPWNSTQTVLSPIAPVPETGAWQLNDRKRKGSNPPEEKAAKRNGV